MSTAGPWSTTAKEICASLADGLDVAGTIETADIFTRIGATCLEVVVEATDAEEPDEQAESYQVLCDLLATRLSTGPADEIIGCLLIATKPNPEALSIGLTHMTRSDGMFVPIIPLSAEQAYAIADSPLDLGDFADDASALIAIAASRNNANSAQTLLDEIDELVSRRSTTPNA